MNKKCERVLELCKIVNGTAPSGVSFTWQANPGSVNCWSASAGGVTATGRSESDALDVLVMALKQRVAAQLADHKASVSRLQSVLDE